MAAHVEVLMANLSAVFNAAMADGLIPANPCASPVVKAPRVDKSKTSRGPLSRLTRWRPPAHPARYSTIPFVTSGLGLRQGEVFGLSVGDVDFLRRWVLVRQQIDLIRGHLVFAPPKGRKKRYVPLPEVVGVRPVAAHEGLGTGGGHPAVKELGGPLHTSTLLCTSRESKPLNRNFWNPHSGSLPWSRQGRADP